MQLKKLKIEITPLTAICPHSIQSKIGVRIVYITHIVYYFYLKKNKIQQEWVVVQLRSRLQWEPRPCVRCDVEVRLLQFKDGWVKEQSLGRLRIGEKDISFSRYDVSVFRLFHVSIHTKNDRVWHWSIVKMKKAMLEVQSQSMLKRKLKFILISGIPVSLSRFLRVPCCTFFFPPPYLYFHLIRLNTHTHTHTLQ